MAKAAGKRHLDYDRVVTAGVDLARRQGLNAVTMSGVARQLGVTPMALYRYVKDRDALVSLVVEAINDGIEVPEFVPDSDWTEIFVAMRQRVRDRYAHFPGLAEHVLALGGAGPTPGGRRLAEWFVQRYLYTGLPPTRAAVAYATFRDLFLLSLIGRAPAQMHQHDSTTSGLDMVLRQASAVSPDERFQFATELFLTWIQAQPGA